MKSKKKVYSRATLQSALLREIVELLPQIDKWATNGDANWVMIYLHSALTLAKAAKELE